MEDLWRFGFRYKAAPTLSLFHESTSFMRGLVGPIGSGKTVACIAEILLRSAQQVVGPDGLRRSRWLVASPSVMHLIDCTIPAVMRWIGPGVGPGRHFNREELTFRLVAGDIDLEILFRSVPDMEAAEPLIGLDLTGAWINEAAGLPYLVPNMLLGRVGRFPTVRDGGAGWCGVIMDTNPCDTDHWWYRDFVEYRRQGWEVFHQPSGLSPEAENLHNLPAGYYQNIARHAQSMWVSRYVDGLYGPELVDEAPISLS